MGIFEERSIVLDENIVNVKEWLTPEEAIAIFISTGYQLEFKESKNLRKLINVSIKQKQK
ncbi:hypothetical protein HUG21_001464 [Listeria monocytogenes]|uniref:hypothetical protein n=1 Tax=Listeria seeligeri TaxID=1640 RepID=UPI0010B35A75|nr:hypothetical protein [Listeria seeligeri]EAD6807831.1 hypothetical protein [Listeria monocytogenes]EAE8699144.1 hypothetical protein [Listeria monocytogenes]EAF2306286.1 hypothetical protein [Listeria monocytogenes]EAG2492014.1 hypothetical protein [Listeria monocytogenes]EFU3041194.1 hypothetical protein [Listeria monocytogenes]